MTATQLLPRVQPHPRMAELDRLIRMEADRPCETCGAIIPAGRVTYCRQECYLTAQRAYLREYRPSYRERNRELIARQHAEYHMAHRKRRCWRMIANYRANRAKRILAMREYRRRVAQRNQGNEAQSTVRETQGGVQ